jgi:uncharacterized protein
LSDVPFVTHYACFHSKKSHQYFHHFIMKKLTLLLFLTCLLFNAALAQLAIPELWNMRVHDEAKVLSPEVLQQLERKLALFEDSTSNQLAVLIIPSLEGEIVEQYALKVAEAWKLGTKKNDNGALLLIVINDRKMRIEVGQGLEGVLTDALTSRIIRNEIAPAFRRQDYNAGVIAGVQAIMAATKGEYKGTGSSGVRGKGRSGVSVFGAFLIFLIIIVLSRIRGGGNNGGSGWSSSAGWFAAGMLGGSAGGSSGSGFGGFSGGGGSFGGGGSSGSW